LTFLLFLKMADEQNTPLFNKRSPIPGTSIKRRCIVLPMFRRRAKWCYKSVEAYAVPAMIG
jgi:hypothetical protein